ncbi:CidA/LrgA family protein [Thalassotalea profundi]|uniref:CidA/LrgA family protein n=1 Tax=Thalassotalea profundi TaxID=2036687 RepID=A0ABQ3IJA2_9GAMM|nr:CidA/LrgA family protein [Thalassotalea profundi]GHE81218.1 hypothetical protein GCM10011501_06660 [Thalassotalea profundi]
MTKIIKHQWINIAYAIVSLLICLGLGYGISAITGGLPPSLYGMAILTLSLQLKWISAERISVFTTWAIRHMGVCFVPAGVGIIEHKQLIQQHGLAIVAITFVTTFLVLTFVGLIYQKHEEKSQTKPTNNDTSRHS